jgi:hypothetical protein
MIIQEDQVKDGALLMSAGAAAKSLSISVRYLWALTNSRQIASIKIGRRTLYDPADIREYIEKNKTKSSVK